MGRPREFDMDQALEQAVQAFWNHGYEATSLSDLMETMDLRKGSIYKAFGDKHSLFIAALDRYLDDLLKFNEEAFESGDTPKDAVRLWLNSRLKKFCEQPLNRGCLIINSLVEDAYQDKVAAEKIKTYFTRTQKLLTKTIKEGQDLNQFRKDFTASELSQLINVSLVGMVAMSKGAISKNACLKIVKNILKLIEI